jgi:lysophospholipase L1-like esterase
MGEPRRYRQPRGGRARIVLVAGLVLLLAGGAVLAYALTRDGDDRKLPAAVSLIGDSLNVGIEPYLAAQLPGWSVSTDDVPGRTTAQGVAAMRAAQATLGPRVLVSLGTNDVFTAPETFRASVREALAVAGEKRCVVWFTIFRAGDSVAGLNDVLRDEANGHDNLRLVDWAELARSHPDWLTSDGIHATESGYRRRAQAAADALRDC